jgi:hypothetical protein
VASGILENGKHYHRTWDGHWVSDTDPRTPFEKVAGISVMESIRASDARFKRFKRAQVFKGIALAIACALPVAILIIIMRKKKGC